MADLLIRNIDSNLKDELQARALRNGRSQQAEAAAILEAAVAPSKDSWVRRLRHAAERVGGVDLPLPERHAPRDIDTEAWA